MKIKVTNIKWDREVDGEIVDTPLPETLELELDDEDFEDDDELDELISDKVTEQTGFCHKGFDYEILD